MTPVWLATVQRTARPVWLTIPAIGVRAAVQELGLNPDGTLQVPTSTTVTGWYTGSPRPGAVGSAIIVGHVVLRHASYGDVSSYMPVSAGQYTVAMRPAGAPASSPPVVSTSFMVSADTNYTVASLGPAAERRLEVLKDEMAAPKGTALVRVIQASLTQHLVTVGDGHDVLAHGLAFGSVTSYKAVRPGAQIVRFSAPGDDTAMPVTLTAGSVHTIVVLDGSSGLRVDVLTDAAGSQVNPYGGAATGLGGTAPQDEAAQLVPWLATLAAGLLLVTAGVVGLRRARRTAAVRE